MGFGAIFNWSTAEFQPISNFDLNTARTSLFMGGDIGDTIATAATYAIHDIVDSDFHSAGDLDYFAVDLEAGATYGFNVYANSFADWNLRVLSADGTEQASGNVNVGNNFVGFVAPEAGTYYIELEAYAASPYTFQSILFDDDHTAGFATDPGISTIDFGSPTTASLGPYNAYTNANTGNTEYFDADYFQFDVVAGNSYDFDLVFDLPSEWEVSMFLERVTESQGSVSIEYLLFDFVDATYEATETETLFVAVSANYTGTDLSVRESYDLSITEIVDDYGDTNATAGSFVAGDTVIGAIEVAGDVDVLAVTLNATTALSILPGSAPGVSWSLTDANGAIIFPAIGADGSTVFYPIAETGEYYLTFTDIIGEPSTYQFQTNVIQDDFGNSVSAANVINLGDTAAGFIDYAGDADVFSFNVSKAGLLRLDLGGSPGSSTSFALTDSDGNNISTIDNGNGFVVYDRQNAGDYVLRVTGTEGSDYFYTPSLIVDDYAADASTTGTLTVGSSLIGGYDFGGDEDWIAVDLVAGETYEFLVDDLSFDGSPFLPSLTLFDATGENVRPLPTGDLVFVLPGQSFSFTPDETGTYYLSTSRGDSGTYQVSANTSNDAYGDVPATAGTLAIGESVSSTIDFRGDNDMFLVSAEAGQSYIVRIESESLNGFFARATFFEQDFTFAADINYLFTVSDTIVTVEVDETGDYAILISDGFNSGLVGDYTLSVSALNIVDGTDSNDSLIGTPESDNIIGGDGDDIIEGRESTDFLDGGNGNDTIDGGAGDDTIYAGDGDDTVSGGEGDDAIWGVAGSNILFGNDGDDIIYSQGDDAYMNGGLGLDVLAGGIGDETMLGGEMLELSATEAQVYRVYQATLNRAPDAVGLAGWQAQLDSGAVTLLEVIEGFVGSAEFANTYGALSDSEFVELLYNNVLGRNADPAGLEGWLNFIDGGGTRAQVVNGFSESLEFINQTELLGDAWATHERYGDVEGQVYRLYQATLGREPDPNGFKGWIGVMENGSSLLDIIPGFVNSLEFQQVYGALENSEFIELLYNNVLGRPADPGGLQGWTNFLENGGSRAEVVRGFSQSAEFIAGTADAIADYMVEANLGWGDYLAGDEGDNVLFGGRGADTLAFFADDTANNIVHGIEAWDFLQFWGFGYISVSDVEANLTIDGDDVVFADQSMTVTFKNVGIEEVLEAISLLPFNSPEISRSSETPDLLNVLDIDMPDVDTGTIQAGEPIAEQPLITFTAEDLVADDLAGALLAQSPQAYWAETAPYFQSLLADSPQEDYWLAA